MENEKTPFREMLIELGIRTLKNEPRKVCGDLAVVDGRLFTDLRVLADAINVGRASFGEEALEALTPLRDAREPRGPFLYAVPHVHRGRVRIQASVVEVVGLTPSRRHATTRSGVPLSASRLHTWSGSIGCAWRTAVSDRLHRLDGPAVERAYGEEWWCNGKRHRLDAPAITSSDWHREWWVAGKRHRHDGPAVEWGRNREWWLNGERHRERGPAVVTYKRREWWEHGALHRLEGPAIVTPSGREWYVNGVPHRDDGPADLQVEDGSVVAMWLGRGARGTTVRVHPRLYREATLPFLEPLFGRGDVSRLATFEDALPCLMAIPACRRAVLEALSERSGDPSDFVGP